MELSSCRGQQPCKYGETMGVSYVHNFENLYIAWRMWIVCCLAVNLRNNFTLRSHFFNACFSTADKSSSVRSCPVRASRFDSKLLTPPHINWCYFSRLPIPIPTGIFQYCTIFENLSETRLKLCVPYHTTTSFQTTSSRISLKKSCIFLQSHAIYKFSKVVQSIPL